MRTFLLLGVCILSSHAFLHDWVCNEKSVAEMQVAEITAIILSKDSTSIESRIALIENIILSHQSSMGSASLDFVTQYPFNEFAASSSQPSSLCGEGMEIHNDSNILLSIIMSLILTLCASLAAGLTMGLVSIEPLEMAIKLRSGTEEEVQQAQKILPLVTRHHFLLVSLLLFNSLAFEALPLFLDNIFSPAVAVIISVTLILFLGEILPSAIFTGPNQLRISAFLSPLVWVMMFVFAPISWPVGKLLDHILGVEEYKRYNRAEISALVEVQHDLSTQERRKSSTDLEGGRIFATENPLHPDEVAIVLGVLGVGQKSVSDAMVLFDRVYSLNIDQVLDSDCMASIMAAGHSRIPVFEGENRRNIRGYLQVKKLIVLNPDDARCIRSLVLRIPEVVSPNSSLLELLNIFQLGRAHLALVSDDPESTREALKERLPLEGQALPIGIICLEDILEEIIQEEILDESDLLVSYAETRAKATLAKYARRRKYKRKLVAPAAGLHALGRAGSKSTILPTFAPRTPKITEKTPLQPKS
jgi:metal transporter CNNM